MSMFPSRPMRQALACALVLALPAAASAQDTFSRTVFFGDSLTDSGYFRPVLMQINPSASLVGRFTTNPGWVWAEHLAKHYGTDASANGNGQSGDNYAVGGARVGTASASALGAIPAMTSQMASHLAANGGRADPNALYTVWGGANDLFAIAGGAPAQATIAQAVTSQIGMVAGLQAAGAQYVLVPNLPDVGITPQFLAGGPLMQAQGTALATSYNAALYGGLAAQGLRVIPLDTFGLLREVVSNPGAYGFRNATQMACTSGQSISCLPTEFAAPDAADSYVFADGVHPTTRTHAIVADYTVSVLEGPRQVQLVARSAQASGRARSDQVATHLAPGTSEGTQWWGGLRADHQRYGHGDHFSGTAPSGLFGADWVKTNHALGLFAGYGQMKADLGHHGGDFRLGETTLGGFAAWQSEATWVNWQLSYTWLDSTVHRHVHLGPVTRIHRGKTDGHNITAAINAGWEFSHDRLHHGPVLGVNWQELRFDAYGEDGGGSTALNYDRLNYHSLVGRAGWQVRWSGGRIEPYARLTWDHDFEDNKDNVSAQLQSQAALGFYQVPGVRVDHNYGTALLGARAMWGSQAVQVGVSSTFARSGAQDTSVFASVSGNW